MKKEIWNKKNIIRAILFAIAFITAITAFTKGVLSLSDNKEGYRTIDASAAQDALLYANDFTFTYNFTGSSRQIRELKGAVREIYSGALLRAYKLLDPKNTYDGYYNLATLNIADGNPVAVGKELYSILEDAYDKTLADAGFNMFAGALYDYVNSILILEDPAEFDPENDPETAGHIAALAELAANPEYFSLRFYDDPDFTVSFTVSDEYRRKAAELEAEEPVLNLNLLKDAYMLDIVVNALDEAGYTDGYISSKSGLTYALSEQKGLEYCIYGLNGNIPAILETLPNKGRTVYSTFKAFGLGNESLYYTVEKNGRTLYRHPYISALDGSFDVRYLSLGSILYLMPGQSDGGNKDGSTYRPAADTVFRNLRIWAGADSASADDGFETFCVPLDRTDTVIR